MPRPGAVAVDDHILPVLPISVLNLGQITEPSEGARAVCEAGVSLKSQFGFAGAAHGTECAHRHDDPELDIGFKRTLPHDLQVGEVSPFTVGAIPAIGMDARVVADHAVVIEGEYLWLYDIYVRRDMLVVILQLAAKVVGVARKEIRPKVLGWRQSLNPFILLCQMRELLLARFVGSAEPPHVRIFVKRDEFCVFPLSEGAVFHPKTVVFIEFEIDSKIRQCEFGLVVVQRGIWTVITQEVRRRGSGRQPAENRKEVFIGHLPDRELLLVVSDVSLSEREIIETQTSAHPSPIDNYLERRCTLRRVYILETLNPEILSVREHDGE